MRELYIWGAGTIGERILHHLDDDWKIIFVDSNKQLVDLQFCEKTVIGVEEYLQKYSDKFILIAHLHERESLEILQDNNITNYFIHSDLPGEFKEPYIREYLKEYVVSYLGKRNNYALYGLNLYSIIIDEWIYKKYGYHPCILMQNDISEEFSNKIIQQYENLNVVKDIEENDDLDEICVCSYNYEEIRKIDVLKKYKMTDLYDCCGKIESYHNVAIKKFHNLYEKKRCFIVATGPSLRKDDLNLLKEHNEICISMNTIYYIFHETKWRPDYYVVSDHRMFDEYENILMGLAETKKFLSDNSETFWSIPHEENVFRYHQHYEYCCDRLPKFSEDFSLQSYMGGTVTYTCMQLAVYMGFKEIYLLGVDFSYGGQEKNIGYGHFYETDNQDNTNMCIGHVKHVTLAYQAARQYADGHSIKIYNATRGGKLEIFERVDFDDLFN